MSDSSLDNLYATHLATLMQRTDRALAATGFDALVIHAGRPPIQFLDDQDYPYKVNPQFKAWVPIVDNPRCILVYSPDARPKVLFYQPNDFWHKPAKLPQAPWTNAVELIVMDDDAKAAGHWANLGRVAFIGPDAAGADTAPANLNPPDLMARLNYDRAVKTPYELECMRRASELGARAAVICSRGRCNRAPECLFSGHAPQHESCLPQWVIRRSIFCCKRRGRSSARDAPAASLGELPLLLSLPLHYTPSTRSANAWTAFAVYRFKEKGELRRIFSRHRLRVWHCRRWRPRRSTHRRMWPRSKHSSRKMPNS